MLEENHSLMSEKIYKGFIGFIQKNFCKNSYKIHAQLQAQNGF